MALYFDGDRVRQAIKIKIKIKTKNQERIKSHNSNNVLHCGCVTLIISAGRNEWKQTNLNVEDYGDIAQVEIW